MNADLLICHPYEMRLVVVSFLSALPFFHFFNDHDIRLAALVGVLSFNDKSVTAFLAFESDSVFIGVGRRGYGLDGLQEATAIVFSTFAVYVERCTLGARVTPNRKSKQYYTYHQKARNKQEKSFFHGILNGAL